MAGINDTDRPVVLRILDANANRCAEGLRVVEEIVRFSMEDGALTRRLKEIRHDVRRTVGELARGALAHRDGPGDVGRSSATPSELARGSLAAIARANFARAEEALRVLEEFGKLIDAAGSGRFKSLRFALYAIEADYFALPGASVSMPRAPFLYAILDRSLVPHADVRRVANALIAGGADIVQYRSKGVGDEDKRRDVAAILEAARGSSIPVVVNDDVELTREAGADGVHVGAGDMTVGEARSLLGPGRIIGVSAYTLDELERVALEPVDYVAVGAIYPSPTKPEVRSVGVDFVRLARSRISKPIVAIGGITPSNAAEVIAAGADGIAVISALLAGDVRKNCFTFKEITGTPLRNGED